MAPIKITDSARKVKNSIVAGSLKEVLEKGIQKLELDTQPNEVTLVLEECGTEFDDDEVLTEFAGMSKVFMLLKKGRSWTKEQEGSADESAPRSVVTCSNPVNECAPVLDQLSQSQTERIGKDCPNTGSASASELTPQPRELVTYHTPFPVFTDYVKCKLTDGFSKEVWGKMINQAAEYYLSKFPRIGESSEYQSIGEKMYRAYPSILSEGRNPWALFCKDLSQRIRWLRWSRNKKSNLGKSINNNGQPPEKVFRMENMKRTASPAVSLESTSIDYDKNVEALQQEHHKRQPSDTSIKALLRETFEKRIDWIRSILNGKIKPIIEKFPVFECGKNDVYELSPLIGKEEVKGISERLVHLQTAVEEITGKKSAGKKSMLPIIEYLEKNTQLDKGKGMKSKSVICTKKDIPDGEKDGCLSKEAEAPYMCLFVCGEEEEVEEIIITGDGVQIYTQSDTVMDGLLILMAVYYAFHLQYPRIYSQFLGLLQEFVFLEPYKGTRSKKFKLLCTELNKKMRK